MQLNFEHQGNWYQCATEDAKSIAIELDFAGPQPNHFGVPSASSAVLKLDGFVGDTGAGGSCNVEQLQLIPHCNGTHTETVGHIVNQNVGDNVSGNTLDNVLGNVWVGQAAIRPIMVALLVTVTPQTGSQTSESYRPELEDSDKIIDSRQLLEAINQVCDVKKFQLDALIVRTRPNGADKCSQAYTGKNAPPFFTVESIEAINSLKVEHLLVDFPSIDRMYDDGLLTNHHLFWSVPETTHELTESTERNKTITEMIYVADEIADGLFGLSIQVPALSTDAAPSRPIVMPLRPVKQPVS